MSVIQKEPVTANVYEYSVLRYSHDPVAGEHLNIGVLAYCPNNGSLAWRINEKVKRLSEAFATFDTEQYRRSISGLERSLENKAREIKALTAPGVLRFTDPPKDLEIILKGLYADQDLSFQFGAVRGGVTDNIDVTLHVLYERFVSEQYDNQPRLKRDDEKVWAVYHDVLRRERVSEYLEPKTFQIGDFEYKFQHAFRNGAWYAFKPVSMDYSDKGYIKERVDKLIGESQVLQERNDLNALYILLGRPSNPDFNEAYANALRLLRRQIPETFEVVEEESADEFGRRVASFIRSHVSQQVHVENPESSETNSPSALSSSLARK